MPEFELTEQQRQSREMIHGFAESVVRPISLEADRSHRIPDDFLQRLGMMASAMPGARQAMEEMGAEEGPKKESKGPSQANRFTMIGAEEMAWGDASMLLNLPGPGLGGPP